MGKSQRTKGAAYEREVASDLSDALGCEVKRNITQARDGGDDIPLGPYRVECKRRKTLTTLYGWMAQIERSCATSGGTPVVIARGDGGPSLVVMEFATFTRLVREEVRAWPGVQLNLPFDAD